MSNSPRRLLTHGFGFQEFGFPSSFVIRISRSGATLGCIKMRPAHSGRSIMNRSGEESPLAAFGKDLDRGGGGRRCTARRDIRTSSGHLHRRRLANLGCLDLLSETATV